MVEDDVLTISGEGEEKHGAYLRRERRYGPFSRSMALPAGVDSSTIEVKVQDGVLEVTILLGGEQGNGAVTITAFRLDVGFGRSAAMTRRIPALKQPRASLP